MEIKPLTGQVLLLVLPPESNTAGGLILPDIAQLTARGEKALPRKAVVMAIGPWRKTKQGFAVLPEIKLGDKVLVSEYIGVKMTRAIGENLRLCRVHDILAVIEEASPAATAELA